MECLTPSQQQFLEEMRLDTRLSRQAVWRHDIQNPPRPQARVQFWLSSSTADFRRWIEDSVQEPEAEAWNCLLWKAHESPTEDDDASSVTPSCSGDLFQERERLAAYLALSPERKAALCGWDFSCTAATRMVGFVQLSTECEPPASSRKRLRDIEEDLLALRGRMDHVEERTGTVLGESSKDCHAFRLARLERACGIQPSGS